MGRIIGLKKSEWNKWEKKSEINEKIDEGISEETSEGENEEIGEGDRWRNEWKNKKK